VSFKTFFGDNAAPIRGGGGGGERGGGEGGGEDDEAESIGIDASGQVLVNRALMELRW
jgi:hypothetical protein